MVADRARRGTGVKRAGNEKTGDERSLLGGQRLKSGAEFDKAER